ncbi:hypothetical protein FQR65_LT18599 [Abscondita terminalis]|nr:hypothetical protein FQR65_LT18599 [Abscondita terminalis]
MNPKPIILIICSILIFDVKCAKILGIFHIPSHSHQILGTKLLYELAAKGHDVTFITPTPKKEAKNVKIVQFAYPARLGEEYANRFALKFRWAFLQVYFFDLLGLKFAELALNSTEVNEFLSIKQDFDIVIIENFLNAAFRGFCYHFNAHCIMLSTVGPNRWTNHLVANPDNPSYIPELFIEYPSKMNFIQRFSNTIVNVLATLFNHFYVTPKHNEVMQRFFPGAPHMDELLYNSSLILLNSHVSTNAPVPLVPNMIPIGGFHIDPPKKLPQDLLEYLDNAKDGVIYFSMGSNLKSVNMDQVKLNAIFSVFRKLKQKVIWKWENDSLPDGLSHVMVRSWLPQSDILAHPNVKLFITHGGLLSTTETIYHGVPIIGIPIFGDQKLNIANVVQDGYGLMVSYFELTEETLGSAIEEILNNPKYLNKVKEKNRIMHDEPMKPLDKAVFWVEYVLRHNGAPHLKTSALSLNWYQYLLLDVIAFVAEKQTKFSINDLKVHYLKYTRHIKYTTD